MVLISLVDEEEVKSFKEWIKQFIEDQSPFGDLARDMKKDLDLPDSNKRNEIHRYLDMECNACENALDVFNTAFDQYEKYLLLEK